MAKLGEFLRSVRKKNGESLHDISRRAKTLSAAGSLYGNDIGKSTTYFSRVETSKVKVEAEHLNSLSQIYKTDVLLLLSLFYAKEQLPMVKLGGLGDYEEVFFKAGKMQERRTEETDYKYVLPKFRLADSYLVLLFTTIEPCSSRLCHSHEGEEIIRCESGEGVIVFQDVSLDEKEKHLRAGQVIHFGSDMEHSIENRSSRPASFLVIRLLPNPEV